MKKVFLLLAVVAILASCGKEKKFEINGTIKGITEAVGSDQVQLFLKVAGADNALVTIDSVMVDSTGVFKMAGKSSEADMYYLTDVEERPILSFFMDPGDKIVISGDVSDWENVSITGSESQKIYEDYLKGGMTIRAEQQGLYQEYMQAMQMMEDSIKRDSVVADVEARWEALVGKASEEMRTFVKKNNKSAVAAFLINSEMRSVEDASKLDSLVQMLDKSLMETKFIKEVTKRIETLRVTDIGATIPEIKLADTANVEVALSSLRGKYVLVDFWAGWCRPCMEEMPYLVQAYDNYKDKNFTIYGVSLDKDRSSWVDAINRFNMPWINVSDLQYWDCPYVKTFGIQGIPMNILIDGNGVIIAKNLRGAALEAKLAEVIK